MGGPFGTAFLITTLLGAAAAQAAQTVIVSPPIVLSPTRLGTELTGFDRVATKTWCAPDNRGSQPAFVGDLHEGSPSFAAVGFIRHYEPGTQPLPCPRQWEHVMIGRVLFALPDLRGARLLSAQLHVVETDAQIETNRTGECLTAIYQIAINQRTWPAGVERARTQAPLTGGTGVVSVPSLTATHDFDVTRWVGDWLSGRTPNHGFALIGRHTAVPNKFPNQNASCASFLRSLRLTLRVQR
jgi:hypothetical protein